MGENPNREDDGGGGGGPHFEDYVARDPYGEFNEDGGNMMFQGGGPFRGRGGWRLAIAQQLGVVRFSVSQLI